MSEFDPISQALGTETPIGKLERPSLPAPIDAEEKEAPEIDEDFREARANMKELIGQAMEQIPELISLMEQSQSDKMIAAVSGFIKTAADLNTSMTKMTKDIKRLPKTAKSNGQNENSESQVVHNHNAVFVGSTEQLLRMLSERKKNEEQQIHDAEYLDVEEK